MQTAEDARKKGFSQQFRLRSGFRQRLSNIAQADRTVVVDTGLLGGLEILIAASCEQAGAQVYIVETDGPDRTGGIPVTGGSGTRSVFAKQAPDGFLLEV